MKKLTKMLSLMLCIVLLCGCRGSSDKSFTGSETFVKDFEQRAAQFSGSDYLKVFDSTLSTAQRQALQFLYAYMALPDVVDYSGDFYLMNVDYALKARAEMPWGKNIPDREFLHFVLPVRVNNENMDESRKVFYEELKERVKGLSMYDAVLEVNHWCHEKVTYTPSDVRTSSPLATVRTAFGRCGEESTFTVAALRAVGIPARQVYTPRWAHTDSNHAWVEAWVDGQWYFFGACEPEPVLNLGWFNAPASRGMLMHTKAFGKYNGPEEVIDIAACHTEINVTSNYAPVATTTVQVVDEKGEPVKATVEFKIYNYSQFYTAVKKECDEQGTVSLTTGHGDMIAWASKDGKFGYAKFTAGKDNNVKVVLDKGAGYKASVQMDIIPPVERNTVPELTPEQVEYNAKRFAHEDSIRNAYVATFPTEAEALECAQSLQIDAATITEILKESRGNYAAIITFLKGVDKAQMDKALSLLSVISQKDRRDISIEVLNDHLKNSPNVELSSLYARYILNPRVSNEMLTPYKGFFAGVISKAEAEAYCNNPESWADWCRKNIKVDEVWNPLQLCMSPKGVWEHRTADSHSRDIFFVAAARSMGIAARIDEVTGKTQYLKNGEWCDVEFSEAQSVAGEKGVLKVGYKPNKFIDDPRYSTHYTISKIVDGKLQIQSYPFNAGWRRLLSGGLTMDSGDYLVMTGTRMANGGVLANLEFVNVPVGGTAQIQMSMRESRDELQVIGNFNSENLYYDAATKQNRSILSSTGRGYYIIALIDPNSEPTNHFLRDVMPYKEQFELWGQKMVLLFKDQSAASRFKGDDFPNLPSTVVWGTDIDDTISNEIITNMKLKSPNRPVILVADTFNRIVFMSQGYSIGLGEQLVKVINQLSQK